jgi:hypothetical protein
VRLYRILDITLRRPINERIWGLGTVHCCAADQTTPEFDISRIRDSAKVKELLSDLVERERAAKRVSSREFMDGDNADDGCADE